MAHPGNYPGSHPGKQHYPDSIRELAREGYSGTTREILIREMIRELPHPGS